MASSTMRRIRHTLVLEFVDEQLHQPECGRGASVGEERTTEVDAGCAVPMGLCGLPTYAVSDNWVDAGVFVG
jgi:hypothetical protein